MGSEVLNIGGRSWRVDGAGGVSYLWPLDGEPEGGTLTQDVGGWLAALPDDITTSSMRTRAVNADRVLTVEALQDVGAANVWRLENDVWRPVVRPRGRLQLGVLRALALFRTGQWVCGRYLAESDVGGWRFGDVVHQLRHRHGYDIRTAVCNDVLHSTHKSKVGAYRLPGLNGG